MEPVPVMGFAANFSPMPRMAPPPLGKEIEGAETWNDSFAGAEADGEVVLEVTLCCDWSVEVPSR